MNCQNESLSLGDDVMMLSTYPMAEFPVDHSSTRLCREYVHCNNTLRCTSISPNVTTQNIA